MTPSTTHALLEPKLAGLYYIILGALLLYTVLLSAYTVFYANTLHNGASGCSESRSSTKMVFRFWGPGLNGYPPDGQTAYN